MCGWTSHRKGGLAGSSGFAAALSELTRRGQAAGFGSDGVLSVEGLPPVADGDIGATVKQAVPSCAAGRRTEKAGFAGSSGFAAALSELTRRGKLRDLVATVSSPSGDLPPDADGDIGATVKQAVPSCAAGRRTGKAGFAGSSGFAAALSELTRRGKRGIW